MRRPETVRVRRCGLAVELRRLFEAGRVSHPLPRVEEVERGLPHAGLLQARVDRDGGDPRRGERLLDSEGRERVDRRAGVPDQQETASGEAARRVDRRVTPPGRPFERGSVEDRGEGTDARELPQVLRREAAVPRRGTARGVDHHGEVARP